MSDGQNIQIFVRCRPLKEEERVGSLSIDPDQQAVKIESQNKEFHFDQVFEPETPQEDVFEAVVMPLLPQVLQGYNCAVLAYGQTGTGKTYTMEGERSLDINNTDGIGIIPRAVSHIFELLRQKGHDFSVHVSFLELYSEEAYDLLSSPDDTTKLRIFDDKNKQRAVKVEGLKEIAVQSESDIFELLAMGSSKRQTTATLLNACSSRSHSIFTITVSVKMDVMDDREVTRMGKLNLVDLAGSENIARSGAQNKHAREAGNINQSLLTLTRVITALVEKRPHIPYRESKLTRILQDSLGGATRTSMIATISLAEIDLGNTIGTLDYASRARKITNRPESNRQMSRRTASDLEEYRHQLEDLIRSEVAKDFRREVEKIREGFRAEMEEKNAPMEQTITELQDKNLDLAKEIELLQEQLVRTQSELAKTTGERDEKLVQAQEELTRLISEKDTQLARAQSELTQALADKEAELKQVQSELQRVIHDKDEEVKKIQSEQACVINEKNQELKQVHDEMARIKDELNGELKKVQAELAHIKDEKEGNLVQVQGELSRALATKEEELAEEKRRTIELEAKNQELEKEKKIFNYMLNDKQQLIEDIRRDFKKREDDLMARLENTPQLIEPKVEMDPVPKKVAKLSKRAPVKDDDYANMTFTGDDEIVQVSAKKTRSKITAEPKQRQDLTLSGRKRKLTNYGCDIDVSPISPPVRVTRSRNTRRKLAY